jgi:hypothetical protein
MPVYPRHPIAACVLLAALAGCSLDVTQPAQFGAFVVGHVESEAGDRVPGTQIRVGYRTMADCSASLIELAHSASTDSTGSYVIGLVGAGPPQTVCLKLVAIPPAGLSLEPDSILLSDVELPEWSGADSLRIDLVLPPSAPPALAGSPTGKPRRR